MTIALDENCERQPGLEIVADGTDRAVGRVTYIAREAHAVSLAAFALAVIDKIGGEEIAHVPLLDTTERDVS